MALHIGKMIRSRIETSGMNKSEFARRINSTPQNVYSIFKRKSLDTEMLFEISRVLGFDFFQYYTDGPPLQTGTDLHTILPASQINQELNEAKRELEMLRQENKYLHELVRLQRKHAEMAELMSNENDLNETSADTTQKVTDHPSTKVAAPIKQVKKKLAEKKSTSKRKSPPKNKPR
jgi:transcriptional regulator with XRE-family HTH domain